MVCLVRDYDVRRCPARVRLYKTLDNKVDGSVVDYINMKKVIKYLAIAGWARDYTGAVIVAICNPLLVLGRIL